MENVMNENIWNHPGKMFIKYVIPSVLGMVGMSAYILADTFFISVAGGADGIAIIANIWPNEIASIFNSENNRAMQELAVTGIKIYFAGMIFVGVNIVGTGYLGAIGKSLSSSVLSILRGIVVIVGLAFLLAEILEMFGIWLTFPMAELCVMLITIFVLIKDKNVKEMNHV